MFAINSFWFKRSVHNEYRQSSDAAMLTLIWFNSYVFPNVKIKKISVLYTYAEGTIIPTVLYKFNASTCLSVYVVKEVKNRCALASWRYDWEAVNIKILNTLV